MAPERTPDGLHLMTAVTNQMKQFRLHGFGGYQRKSELLKRIHADPVPTIRPVQQRQHSSCSIRALAVMVASQTLTHTLACVLGAMSIAARENPKALRCGLLKTRLLLIVLYFCAAFV